MTRTLDSTLLAAATSNQIAPVLLLEFDFSGGTVRTWTGLGNLTWNGNTYLGTGILLKVGTMGDTKAIAAKQFEFTLGGVDSSMLALVMTEQYQGRGARMYLGAVVNNVAYASQIYGGTMDPIKRDDTGSTATITLTTQNA